MNPETSKRIMDSADGKELATYLAETILATDSLGDIELHDPVEVAVEVKARKKTVEKLNDILNSLLIAKEMERDKADPSEYAM